MAFDERLAKRLESLLGSKQELEETRMFGGFGYLMRGNMCVGIHKDQLIIRIGVPAEESLRGEPHVHPMDITGRAMKGWARIAPEGLQSEEDLKRFCELALDFVDGLPAKPKKAKKKSSKTKTR